ncbi:uncharacterized protein ACR2FA_012197 [Aphomia sociella]
MFKLVALACIVGLAVGGPPVTKSREEIEAFRTYLETTRRDNGPTLEDRMAINPKASAWENSGKFEGDIVLDDEQIEALVDEFASGRNAYIWPNTKWPSDTVVYEFGAGEFNLEQQRALIESINDIERNSCIRFRPRTSSDRNYVRITGGPGGCYASVGYWSTRGVHTMNIARNTPGFGCFNHVVIIHEWLHVLGFLHMQSTYNRDDYVRVMWENIQSGMEHNFDKYESNLVSNLALPYEYTSCMHYDGYGFSINGQPTLVPLRPFEGEMGQIERVTEWDWLRLNRHYNCPGAWSAEVAAENVEKTTFARMLKLAVLVCVLGLAAATPSVVRSREEIESFRSFLESTKTNTDDGELFLARTKAFPLANPEENSGKYQGDIIIDDFIMESMIEEYAKGRNAYIWPNSKWPDNTVVWEFGDGEFGPQQQAAIEEGIRDIEERTCIKFRYRQPGDTVFVRLTGLAGGCYAHVGYWQSRGVHTMNLARNTPGVGCFRHATIVHEWMHILGFLHMQSTYNRDQYVRIVEENLIPGTEHNFDIYTSELVDNLNIEYDYVSCLHYGPFAFTNNGEPTIVALQEHEGDMGQRLYITDKDWLRVNRHYNCPGAWN